MNFSQIFFLGLSLFLSNISFAGLEVDEAQELTKNKLQKSGVELSKAARIILNQHLKAEAGEDQGLYQVVFTCTHKKAGKEDTCQFQKVDFRKTISE